MKYARLITAVILLLGMSASHAATDADAERGQLKAMLQGIEQAINAGDMDNLGRHLHDDVVVTFLNAEVARGVPAVREYFSRMLGSSSAVLKSFRTRATESAPARLYGDIAVAEGGTQDELVFANGSEMSFDSLWSTTLIKQAGQWKVLSLHFSTNVFDNAVLAALENNTLTIAVVAALISLIIGFVVGRMTRRA